VLEEMGVQHQAVVLMAELELITQVEAAAEAVQAVLQNKHQLVVMVVQG
jgi:hypothetical protein